MSGFGIMTDRREAMALAAGAVAIAVVPATFAAAAQSMNVPLGRDQTFDDGWKFLRQSGEGLEAAQVDDSQWRTVDLPHDWSIEDLAGNATGPFNRRSKGGTATGFTEGGEGWYRKHFQLDELPPHARVELSFDGAYLDCDVWLNGHSLGTNVHGYIPFAFDLTEHLNRGGVNVLAVRLRNIGRNSRWYSGSGLYRQVKLDVLSGDARIARWGVAAWTRKIDGNGATIDVSTRTLLSGTGPDQPALSLITRLRDTTGKVVAEIATPASENVAQQLVVRAPHLWSPDQPSLYSLESELRRGTVVVDRLVQPFGIRIVTMDPQDGLAINGKRMKLRGGCIHHDNGLLGACAFADADERRIRLLKARGFNAVRSSHNPASRSLREACDRMGMLLIEEAFDMWHVHKEPDDFAGRFKDHWEDVVQAMVLSARNSPSVIMWSIGNEIPYRSTDEGVEWQWKLANAVRRIDPTRPVTAGLNGVLGGEMIAGTATARAGRAGKTDNASTIFLDVPGYNYRLTDIASEETVHPERVVYASETFAKEAYDYRELAERFPWFLGEFVWTAMDYVGEAGLGATAHLKKGGFPYYMAGFPWVNAWSGDIDLIGHQKASSLARDVIWGISPLEMTVQRPVPAEQFEWIADWGWSDELQSWSWPEAVGKPIAVRLYSSGDKVELSLNGKVIGVQALSDKDKARAEFLVPYEPGKLEATAYKDGRVIARRTLETVSAPKYLKLTAETPGNRCDRQALHYVGIDILDAKHRLVPDEIRKISLTIDGPAQLVAFGSANPLAVGSFQAAQAETFRGRALAILRSTGAAGTVRVTAHAEGLPSVTTSMRVA